MWHKFVREGWVPRTEMVRVKKETYEDRSKCKVWDMDEFHKKYRDIEKKSIAKKAYSDIMEFSKSNYALEA